MGVNLDFMICLRGEKEQYPFLSEIATLGVGIELGSYGLIGIKSKKDWNSKYKKHKAMAGKFAGKVAMHGPFIGLDYSHIDHLLRQTIQKRMDLTFKAARSLKVFRVILHSGLKLEIELFQLSEMWLTENISYWKQEIKRWEKAGIEIVLENEIEKNPDLLVRLVEAVNSQNLQLCLDIGHLHYLSPVSSPVWIKKMGMHLKHIHIHDNDQQADRHWPIGKGTFNFESFFSSLDTISQNVTLSIEVDSGMEEKMNDLKKVINRFK